MGFQDNLLDFNLMYTLRRGPVSLASYKIMLLSLAQAAAKIFVDL